MRSLKKLTALALIASLLVLQVHPAVFADDSDIFGANIQPNVMILFDNSLSMNNNIPTNAYVPDPPAGPGPAYTVLKKCDPVTNKGITTYSDCYTAKVYKSTGWGASTTYSKYTNTVAQVTDAGARTALDTDGYWSGSISGSKVALYKGNYLNFLLGSASGSEPKIVVARRVVNNLLTNVHDIRFGVMTFWYNCTPNCLTSGTLGDTTAGHRGGRVVAPIGTDVETMKTAVNGINPDWDTPLGDFLYDGGQYFKGATLINGSPTTSPIQLSCQPNFIILVTDGQQTSGVRTMASEATNRFTQDHATSLSGVQKVIVHTIGFGILPSQYEDPVQAHKDLEQAAKNGGGQYYKADDQTDLEKALQGAIQSIVKATFTFATPVLPSTSTTGSSRAYLAAFQSDPSRPFWQGFLKAYNRDSNGLVPVDGTGVPLTSALAWEAGQVLSTIPSANRTISTVANETTVVNGSTSTSTGSRTSFDTSNTALTKELLGVSTDAARNPIIDFVRGADVFDEDNNSSTTERSWKLGDVFHSTPVLVTAPALALNDSSYQAFKTTNASRTKVLIAGANDGMLHAFKEQDGSELWAFIPPDLLGQLQSLTVNAGEHKYFVDSSPIAADIKISGVWKTIVVFGLRRGGNTYYALDITDTTSPTFLWSFTDTKTGISGGSLGETWSEPAIGKVKVGGVDKFVAFVGGGYNTPINNASGNAFFVIDLATGAKLWEYYNDGTSDDRQYMNFSIPANPTAVDLTGDGYVDKVYIGDVGGQLWKFDVSANATASWAGKRLFAAPPTPTTPPAPGEYYPQQAIYGAPTLSLGPDRKVWVYFGTGDRNHPNNTTAPNRFYGIRDTTDMTNGSALTESSLVNVTSFNNADKPYGWFFTLGTKEKALSTANVFNMNVLFSTFTPTTTVTCESGDGTAKLYSVQILTGYAGIDFITGHALTTDSLARSKDIGQGIASMPVIVITPPASPGGSASSSAITATSNQQLPANAVPMPPFLKQVRSWRERVQ